MSIYHTKTNHLEEPLVDRRIIVKRIYEKWNGGGRGNGLDLSGLE